MDKGANVDAEDENGDTPLDLATTQDIRTLLQNTDELLKAAGSGDIQEVNSLINKGANVNATDQDGKTPLHWAAVKGHEEVVEALLKVMGSMLMQQIKVERLLYIWLLETTTKR